ncbi:MAG: type III-A CRISPR-associated RAMP protein Csm5 [Hapalosiphonaceae cyanobacterium JJU2]|nr:MAG: type III-A CRISPR-associated RAMP protein Csm5 [Hapalosiphonaceae cyanobacterium JJU2]
MSTNSNVIVQKPKILESQRIRLTSPILHIGSEFQTLNPFEYIQNSNKVYIPNQEALVRALNKLGGSFLQDYIQKIQQRQDITQILNQAFRSGFENEKDEYGNLIFPKTGTSDKWSDDVTNFRPMIRNGMGYRYIPGSSIKGAIRTAITYHILKRQSEVVSDIELKLREKLGNNRKLSDDIFMKNLFSNYHLKSGNNPIGRTSDANTDFMRAIKITDTKPLIERPIKTRKGTNQINVPVVTEVILSSFAHQRTREGFIQKLAKYKSPIYVEMIHEVRTEFTLTLDTEMLSWFHHKQGINIPFKTIEELLNICNEFASAQWNYEQKYWTDISNNLKDDLDFDLIKEEYEKQCPYHLRIGWGCGMPGTTVSLCYEKDKKLMADIRDASASSDKFKAPGYEAPKTRRTVADKDGDIKFVPGWVKLTPINQQSLSEQATT